MQIASMQYTALMSVVPPQIFINFECAAMGLRERGTQSAELFSKARLHTVPIDWSAADFGSVIKHAFWTLTSPSSIPQKIWNVAGQNRHSIRCIAEWTNSRPTLEIEEGISTIAKIIIFR